MPFIQYTKPLDAKEILDNIDDRICNKKINLKLYDIFIKAVKPFDGKKITKRVFTAFEKAVADAGIKYNVYYRPLHCMFHFDVVGNDPVLGEIKWDKRIQFLVGYDSNPVIDMKNIIDYNKRYSLDVGRIPRLEAGKEYVEHMVNEWNAAFNKLKEINNQAEKFELQYTFELPQR